ncbi:MAG: ATP-binding protein [Bacilli bacterium]|jgi:predicted AAA+ superfamily ATPase|nr:ATP-binding protein [Bacilli bacterium]
MDKSEIIAILNDWNYWNKEISGVKDRPLYDKKIAKFIDKDEIVVIKGIRRCGKSTLMLNQIKTLIKSGVAKENILLVNLEDPRFLNHLDTGLLEDIKNTYLEYLNPSVKPYIFLDEIQNIPNWEKWVNKEYELKKSFITITGSNSSMLSSEIATVLSGRYISVDVYPLSFQEFIAFHNVTIQSKLDLVDKKIELNRYLEQFIKYGGFPKTLEYQENEIKELLTTYKDSILLKDIVARFKLKNFHTLEEIAAFLLSNSGIIQSITKLKNNFAISFDMARDYVEYLKKAYMVHEIKKFDYSLKKQNVNDKKYYGCDLGLCNIFRAPNLQTRGDDLETIVFLELKRRGFELYYYKTSNDLECDFVVSFDNAIVELLQVSKSVKDEKTLTREIAPFAKTIDELKLSSDIKCTIITEDNSSEIDGIEILNIQEFLILHA